MRGTGEVVGVTLENVIMKGPAIKEPREKDQNGISFNDFKKALGSAANKYSDREIEQIRATCDKIADIFFDAWLHERNKA